MAKTKTIPVEKDQNLEKTQEASVVIYSLTEEGKKAILQIIGSKPFNTVFNVAQLLEKEELSEQEANLLINVIGGFAYREVADFFKNLASYIIKNSNAGI